MMTEPAETQKPRWWRRIAVAFIVLLLMSAVAAVVVVPRLNQYQASGEIFVLGPSAPVSILRDEKGMPYIHADSMLDAVFGQGFVTAQDRLFQIELMRRQATGELSEFAGEAALDTDIRQRTIGIGRAAAKHTEILDDETRTLFQAFADGVNAFLDTCGDDVPLEFALAGIKPKRWTIEDSLCIIYLMAWDTSANVKHEIISHRIAEVVGEAAAAEISPLNINADESSPLAPREVARPNGDPTGRISIARRPVASEAIRQLSPSTSRSPVVGKPIASPFVRQSTFLPLPFSVGPPHEKSCGPDVNLGSNNWVTAPKMSAGDHAILAGDPHLDPRMLPGIMYAIGIVLPDNRAVGAGVPGIPGFIVGRNKYVATAVTNSYGDVQDLYVETLDPENSAHYLDGGESRPLSIETEVIRVRDAGADEGFREHVLEIASTARGPIVSGVLPGLDSGPPISLRWAAVESMQPRLGLTDLLKAESIEDVERALQTISFIVLNFVFADDQGNIAWRVSGQLPLRSENSGEAPFPVPTDEAWADNWTGWIPFDEMPHRSNPDRGWLGTANHYTVNAAYPYYFTNYASPSYRYRRLKEQMAEKRGRLTIEDHWSIQRDTKNLLAAEVTPILVAALSADAETKPLAAVLADWDFHDNIDHSGPTVFQSVYTEFARAVFADELGEELASMMLGNWYYWQERFQEMVSAGECRWFDDQTTTDRIETRDEMIRRGGRSAMERLSTRFGNDPRAWHWGKVHTIEFVNPIRRSGFGSDWLGTGKIPVAGSGETLYRGWYDLDEPFGVTHTAAVRMVVDFGDDEKVRAVLAGGEVGRTFHPHQQDQIDAYISGKPLHWWFSQEAIEQHATSKLKLVPAR